MTDITAVLTAHREAAMAGVSLRSMIEAVAAAERGGIDVEMLVMLDNPDPMTRAVFSDADVHGWSVHEVSYADQGKVRNDAVRTSRGRYIAFLDGDDLWSENWLVEAHALCESEPGKVIAHPEVNWFFDNNSNIFFHADQTDGSFDPHFLRFANYWDALCLAPREAYEEFPYSVRAVKDGFAYEDWLWSIETLDAGYIHRVATDTIHFKRRQQASQNLDAVKNKCLTRPHSFFSYEWDAAALGTG